MKTMSAIPVELYAYIEDRLKEINAELEEQAYLILDNMNVSGFSFTYLRGEKHALEKMKEYLESLDKEEQWRKRE